MLRQLDSKATVVESTILDMVVSGDIAHAVFAGMVNVSGTAFTIVVLGVAFVTLIENGDDKTCKNPKALTRNG